MRSNRAKRNFLLLKFPATKLIVNLSKYLTDIFGKGFFEANLQNMRKFYLIYPEFPTQCVGNLAWSNIRKIIRIDNPEERNYY